MLIKMDTQADIDAKAKQKVIDTRQAEIMTRLSEIDVAKIRPLTAILLGQQNQDDTKKLNDLDDEVIKLREELKIIGSK